MGQAVQAEVESRIQHVTRSNLSELADVEGFRLDFLRAHGFEVEGVDYGAEITSLGKLLRTSRSIGKRGADAPPADVSYSPCAWDDAPAASDGRA